MHQKEEEVPFNPDRASERSLQAIHAAEVFHLNAASIAARCADASTGEVIVAAVASDHRFRGVWVVSMDSLAATVHEVDDGGWTLTFSPGDTVRDIEDRCLRMARGAFKRWETVLRWSSKNRRY